MPVPVGSGQTFDIGQIAVRKAPLYRVKVTLSSTSCAPGELVQVGLVVRSGFFSSQTNSTPVPCGEPFLMTRLAPGSYWIEARSDNRPAESAERASLPFEIEDKNIEVKSVLARGVDIDLRIVPNEGSRKADWSGVRLMLHPRGRAPYLSEIPGSPDPEGRLRLVNVEARDYDLRFAGLPPGFYIQEVRYNGAAMPFGTLTVNGSAMAHTIEIAVDDKPAAVAGETRPGARVVLARWPINTPRPARVPAHRRRRRRWQIPVQQPRSRRIPPLRRHRRGRPRTRAPRCPRPPAPFGKEADPGSQRRPDGKPGPGTVGLPAGYSVSSGRHTIAITASPMVAARYAIHKASRTGVSSSGDLNACSRSAISPRLAPEG